MAVEKFTWTYKNDLDAPEKVNAISKLIQEYELRGVRFSDMRGEEGGEYLDHSKKENHNKVYGFSGEKYNGTSSIYVTGEGSPEDLSELQSRMDGLLGIYEAFGQIESEEPLFDVNAGSYWKRHNEGQGGASIKGQRISDDTDGFINDKGYGWKSEADKKAYKEKKSPSTVAPETEAPGSSAFFDAYHGRMPSDSEQENLEFENWFENLINPEQKLLTAGEASEDPLFKKDSAAYWKSHNEGQSGWDKKGSKSRNEPYTDNDLDEFINDKGYGWKSDVDKRAYKEKKSLEDPEAGNGNPIKTSPVVDYQDTGESFRDYHVKNMGGKATKKPSGQNLTAYWDQHAIWQTSRAGEVATVNSQSETEKYLLGKINEAISSKINSDMNGLDNVGILYWNLWRNERDAGSREAFNALREEAGKADNDNKYMKYIEQKLAGV